ncbi:MAG: hypothetical protein PVI66_05245 [Candidatus Aminicenantes bacterium]
MALTLSASVTYRILRRLGGIRVKTRKVIPVIAVMELAVAFGIIAFWVVFFSTDMVNIEDSRLKEVYLAFETAFPVADFYLAIMLIIGGVGLLKRKLYGTVFSFMGGASLIFLGLLDVSFNTQQGIYSLGVEEAVMNVFINSLCIGFGSYLVRSVWKERGEQTFSHAL